MNSKNKAALNRLQDNLTVLKSKASSKLVGKSPDDEVAITHARAAAAQLALSIKTVVDIAHYDRATQDELEKLITDAANAVDSQIKMFDLLIKTFNPLNPNI